MATAIFSRRATPLTMAFEKHLFSARRAATTCRTYNNSTETNESESDDGCSIDVYHRFGDALASCHCRNDDFDGSLFSESFDPFFGPSHNINQLLNKMDQLADSPFMASRVPLMWRGSMVKDALYIKVEMPRLGKENVRVMVEHNTLVLKREGEKESSEESARRYCTRIDPPSEMLKLDHIKAEMKKKVLKVSVPKVKEEERKDVI